MPWGARQEVDYSHPAFRFHAERVIRAVIERYADHPAVIGYQVDNEPGMLLFHNRGSFQRFVRRLRAQYGDVETLNREWGLTYWSHRLSDWSDLWTPDGNTLPQYDLAWRRYQADLTTEFIAWQADIVREYARPDQFVTTCIAYPRPAVADEELVEALDITAGNPYYAMQDHLDAALELEPVTPWTSSGVAGMLRQADRLYSSKQSRFLVTETDAQSIGGSSFNLPPYPGQLKQAAFAFVSRGAAMIEYWHWHTLPYGTETYWGGVLPHSLEPGRVYHEVAELGADLAARSARRSTATSPTRTSRSSGRTTAASPSSSSRRSRHPTGSPITRRTSASSTRSTAASSTPARSRASCTCRRRTPWARPNSPRGSRCSSHPGCTSQPTPTSTSCATTRRRAATSSSASARATATRRRGRGSRSHRRGSTTPRASGTTSSRTWPRGAGRSDRAARGIRRQRRSILGRRAHQHAAPRRSPATTTRGSPTSPRSRRTPTAQGASRSSAPFRRPAGRRPRPLGGPSAVADELAAGRALPVTVASGSLPDGRRAWFVFNWGWEPQAITLAASVADPVTGDQLQTGTDVSLPAWSARTFVGQ